MHDEQLKRQHPGLPSSSRDLHISQLYSPINICLWKDVSELINVPIFITFSHANNIKVSPSLRKMNFQLI